MKYRVLVFDFDGTVADTFNFVLTIINRLSTEFGFRRVEFHEVETLKGKTPQEIISHLRIPTMKVPAIMAQVRRELRKDISSIKPVEGLKRVLLQLRLSNHRMGILTSNSPENVATFLRKNRLEWFDFISTTSRIWGKSRRLKALLVKRGLQSGEVLYVGDEIRDIEAARKAGVKIAAVTWGYNSRKVLEAHKPDYLVTEPEGLLPVCEVS